MCEIDESARKCFDELVRKVAKSVGGNFRRTEHQLSLPNDSFYLSDTVFVAIRLYGEGDECRTLKVVAKKASNWEYLRIMLNVDLQFHNEIVFYRRYADCHGNYPKCIYIEEKPPFDSIIVLEDVSERGYRMHERKYDLPMDDVVVAVKEAARFHAKGYVMKEKRARDFFDIVKDLKEARYRENNEKFVYMLNYVAPRAVKYLRKEGYDALFCDKMEVYLNAAYRNVMLKAINATEPLATLCHGDLTINNLLFKRDGAQTKAMLIDFALICYASPSIDISTFLSLSCFEALKRDNLEKIFRAYHAELVDRLTQEGIEHLERFSYEAMLADYKRHALFGYVIATFFLATLMGKVQDPREYLMLDDREIAKIKMEEGGEEVSEILAKMLLELKESGCLDHIL